MQTQPSDSTMRSDGSTMWTPEQVQSWLDRVHRQDEASAKVRKSLGQIVTEAHHWQRSRAATTAFSRRAG